jgi:hypothetical protein
MRMLGPSGNPTAENLFSVIKQLKEQDGLEFDIRVGCWSAKPEAQGD